MQREVTVRYKNEKATYGVVCDRNGLYQAKLMAYEGSPDIDPPPSQLLLFKGIKGWVGSTEQTSFLNELGECLESLYACTDYIMPKRMDFADRSQQQGSSPDGSQNRAF